MDPAGTGLGDETGLIAGGRGIDERDYLTHDWSARLTPNEAARRAWELFEHTHADVLVYEDNFGKGWVKEVLSKTWAERTGRPKAQAPLAEVWASAGKQLRAQPVVMRYEQDRVSHVGSLPELEDQYTTWMPNEPDQRTKSPDRVDAAVHLVTHLMKRFDGGAMELVSPHSRVPKGGSVHPLMAARLARQRREAERRA